MRNPWSLTTQGKNEMKAPELSTSRRAAFTQSVTYRIEGMNSPNATESLKASLQAHRGVDAVEVLAERGEVRIVYEPAHIDAARIADAIEKSGHRVLNPQRWGC